MIHRNEVVTCSIYEDWHPTSILFLNSKNI
jgi:hypothetical protein